MTHSWLSRIIYGAYARSQVCAGSEGMKISMGEDGCRFMWTDKGMEAAADDSAVNIVRFGTASRVASARPRRLPGGHGQV